MSRTASSFSSPLSLSIPRSANPKLGSTARLAKRASCRASASESGRVGPACSTDVGDSGRAAKERGEKTGAGAKDVLEGAVTVKANEGGEGGGKETVGSGRAEVGESEGAGAAGGGVWNADVVEAD